MAGILGMRGLKVDRAATYEQTLQQTVVVQKFPAHRDTLAAPVYISEKAYKMRNTE